MNEADKILTLLEKGYTKAEIDAMFMPPAPADPESSEAVQEPTPAEPVPIPEPEPAPEPASETLLVDELSGFMAELKQSIADLTAAVQSNNIRTASVNTMNIAEEQDKILASFINPPGRDK